MTTNRAIAMMWHQWGLIEIPYGTRLTHQGPTGEINPAEHWVADSTFLHHQYGEIGHWMQLDLHRDGILVPADAVEYTEFTLPPLQPRPAPPTYTFQVSRDVYDALANFDNARRVVVIDKPKQDRSQLLKRLLAALGLSKLLF